MPETPRTDGLRNRVDGLDVEAAASYALMLIAEMLERIAIALEKEGGTS